VSTQRLDFVQFYCRFKDECLLTVLVSVGDRDTAQELVAEAFAQGTAAAQSPARIRTANRDVTRSCD
jgi:hypothetical protein